MPKEKKSITPIPETNETGTVRFKRDYGKVIQAKFKKSTTRVVLLGEGRAGLKERRSIARELEMKGISAIVPEDVIPPEMAPDVNEKFIVERDDVDLVFVNPASWGSVLEFGQFAKTPKTARKLRILVKRRHHPLYGAGGYVTSSYFTHELIYGHVYICKSASDSKSERIWIPSKRQLILKIAERYQEWKALNSK
jgi:hypothetical protein